MNQQDTMHRKNKIAIATLIFGILCGCGETKADWDQMNDRCDSYEFMTEVNLTGDLPVFTLSGTGWSDAVADDDNWKEIYVGYAVEEGIEHWGEAQWPVNPVESITWGEAPAGWDATDFAEEPTPGTEYRFKVEMGPIENGGEYRVCSLGDVTFTAP
ncbi:MAG: hypothetical protein CMK59_07800 [Proteobacteria bacterium]|nr:hypothetical protein [Pseudomonadota bacterium]